MSAGPNPAGPNPLGQDSLGPIAVDVDAPDPALLARVGEILRGGGVVAHPSDTIFGLAAAAHSAAGLARLRALKGRAEDRPFIVLIDEPARVEGLTHSTPRYVIPWISRIWPAPLTLILKARPDAPGRAPDGSVALRCPAQALTRGMVREVAGVMASTSANRAGESPALNATQALEVFGLRPDGVDLILADAGADPAAPAGLPSTIIDCRGAEPRVIRVGAVSLDRLGIAAS